MKPAVILSMVLAALQFAVADDFKTVTGKEYTNAKLSRVEPDGIVITFSGGIVKIPFTELSAELQKQYSFDPQAAADFRHQVDDAAVTRARGVAEAQAAVNARNAELGAK